MDNIVKVGSREKIKNGIAAGLSISDADAEKIFEYLAVAYEENGVEFGCVNQSTDCGQGLVFGGGQYYINLPKSIAVVVALILDITLTKGVISGVCGILGVQSQAFYNINQHNGETCLLREYLRRKSGMGASGYGYLAGNECVNNDLECRHRDGDGKCNIGKEDIEKVLSFFREAQIIKC